MSQTQNNTHYFQKSCTRVDLSGGTLDLWPLSTLVPEATTINCSIDCFTFAEFKKNELKADVSNFIKIFVKSPDFDEKFEFKSLTDLYKEKNSKLALIQESFKEFFNTEDDKRTLFGEWTLVSESPAGSGLGGSSSLLVSLIKVIAELKNITLSEAKMVCLAKNIESRVLQKPAGIQDYFSPIKPGFNCISFSGYGFKRDAMNDVLDFWKNCFTLVDSKIKHHSGLNNWEILKNFVEQKTQSVQWMNGIAKVSKKTKLALENKSIKDLARCFQEELEIRKNISNSYVPEDVSLFLNNLLKSSDLVVSLKLCGAGGGGCILVLHDPTKKEALKESLTQQGFSVLPFTLSNQLNV